MVHRYFKVQATLEALNNTRQKFFGGAAELFISLLFKHFKHSRIEFHFEFCTSSTIAVVIHKTHVNQEGKSLPQICNLALLMEW